MHTDLRDFLTRLAATVVMTLAPVVFIAFVSMPMSLGVHPGEAPLIAHAAFVHMT